MGHNGAGTIFNINRIKDNDGLGSHDLRFKFVNTGKHLTFIDTIKNEYKLVSSSLTKPGDTSELNIINYKWKTGKQRDTVIYFTIPFYYEGKTMQCFLFAIILLRIYYEYLTIVSLHYSFINVVMYINNSLLYTKFIMYKVVINIFFHIFRS